MLDADGNEMEAELLYLPLYGQFWNLEMRTWGFNIFKVSREGEISTRRPGEYAVHGPGGGVRRRSVGPGFRGRRLRRTAHPADHPARAR